MRVRIYITYAVLSDVVCIIKSHSAMMILLNELRGGVGKCNGKEKKIDFLINMRLN